MICNPCSRSNKSSSSSSSSPDDFPQIGLNHSSHVETNNFDHNIFELCRNQPFDYNTFQPCWKQLIWPIHTPMPKTMIWLRCMPSEQKQTFLPQHMTDMLKRTFLPPWMPAMLKPTFWKWHMTAMLKPTFLPPTHDSHSEINISTSTHDSHSETNILTLTHVSNAETNSRHDETNVLKKPLWEEQISILFSVSHRIQSFNNGLLTVEAQIIRSNMGSLVSMYGTI